MLLEKAFSTLRKDARLSNKQRNTLEQALKQDPNSEIFGLDKMFRPVIKTMSGIPKQPTIWAVLRSGEPGDPAWEDKALGQYSDNLAEPWY